MTEWTLLLLRLVMVVGMLMAIVGVVPCLCVCLVEMLVRHDTVYQYQRIGKKGEQQYGDPFRHQPKLANN